MRITKPYQFIVFILLTTGIYCGCNVYSFTGASIPPDVKTISIDYMPNRAPQVQATLSQKFTEQLKDKFVNQTNLTLINSNGDLMFSGSIIDYRTQPVAIQSTDVAALNRLTITVTINFENSKDETKNFEKSFSAYADYNSSQILSLVEESLIDRINEQLVDDIFNAAVINW